MLNKRLQSLVYHMCYGPSADSGHVSVMIDLLNDGADPTSRSPASGRNALHEFAAAGKWWCLMTVMEVCQEVGVDVNTKCRLGRTPLHEVARHALHETLVTSYDANVDELTCVRRLILMARLCCFSTHYLGPLHDKKS